MHVKQGWHEDGRRWYKFLLYLYIYVVGNGCLWVTRTSVHIPASMRFSLLCGASITEQGCLGQILNNFRLAEFRAAYTDSFHSLCTLTHLSVYPQENALVLQ